MRCLGCDFFLTDNGKICFANRGMIEGDLVHIIHGNPLPTILRRKGPEHFEYVAGGYLEEAMYRELVTWAEDEADEIVLV